MRRRMFKSKIHRATVTQADLHYEGSVTIDANLMEAADILPGEQVAIWNVDRGTRLETYAMRGEAGSRRAWCWWTRRIAFARPASKRSPGRSDEARSAGAPREERPPGRARTGAAGRARSRGARTLRGAGARALHAARARSAR